MLRHVLLRWTSVDSLFHYRPFLTSAFIALLAWTLVVVPSSAQTRPTRVTIIEIDGEPVTETWRYAPASFTVSQGTKVTWLNTGRSAHTVTSPEGLFDSGYLDSGDSWSYEFDTPGVYNYFCVPYPWMKGTVIVR